MLECPFLSSDYSCDLFLASPNPVYLHVNIDRLLNRILFLEQSLYILLTPYCEHMVEAFEAKNRSLVRRNKLRMTKGAHPQGAATVYFQPLSNHKGTAHRRLSPFARHETKRFFFYLQFPTCTADRLSLDHATLSFQSSMTDVYVSIPGIS